MLVKESQLKRLRENHKGRVIVFAVGTFDLFHEGHLNHLKWCAGLGDILVVAVNSDERTKNRKGADRPIFGLPARLKIVDSLKIVDYTVPVEDTSAAYEAPIKTARLLGPDKIGLGNDQSEEYVESWQKAFPDIQVLVSNCPIITSTSAIIGNLANSSDSRMVES
jgi:cytidyltransferase-like protein